MNNPAESTYTYTIKHEKLLLAKIRDEVIYDFSKQELVRNWWITGTTFTEYPQLKPAPETNDEQTETHV